MPDTEAAAEEGDDMEGQAQTIAADGRDGSSRGGGYETCHKEDEHEARESTANANRKDTEDIAKLDLATRWSPNSGRRRLPYSHT